ncbi:MAG: peptidyl-prolyl cis-trans isomerase [Desulfobacterales bacterium]|nr:peptidyl-prolyl cis-trans isomerase [Desulfobacterales bacterium]
MKVLSSARLLLCVTVFLLFFGGGCEEKSELKDRGKTGDGDKKIAAKVGDAEITGAELDAAMDKIPERSRKRYRQRVLNHLIEAKVFSGEARRAGLDRDPKIEEALDKAANEILARYFVKKYVDPQALPSEEEVKKYYLEHTDQFVVPEGVLVRHIVVKKKEQADAVLKAVKGGASFEEISKRKSPLRSRKKGGRLWLYKGRMAPELEKVAFDLETGKLSDVIETKKGYQIIKVLDKSDKRQIGLEEAKTPIRLKLSQERKRGLIHQYYERAKVDKEPGQGVLVKVEDEALTEEALATILAKVPEKEKEKVKQSWIRYFIETKVFSKEAKKVGLETDPQVADELKRSKDEILAKAFRQKFVVDKCKVSDEEVGDYYQAHLEKFKIPLRVRIRSIVVTKREEAEEILKELKGGAAFSHLAIKRSVHPSAPRGGELGWFGEGEKDPTLEKAAFAIEKGQISDIIKTESGCEIIKVMDKKGGGTRSLEEVHSSIKTILTRKKIQAEKERYFQKAGVKVLGA